MDDKTRIAIRELLRFSAIGRGDGRAYDLRPFLKTESMAIAEAKGFLLR
jgi:hypothetical protein